MTGTITEQTASSLRPGDLHDDLKSHNWREPLHVSIQQNRKQRLRWIGLTKLPMPLRRAMTLWYMTYYGGVFEDWVRACRPYAHILSDAFQPQLVWGTFGNTSTLILAQYLARQAECQWVIDVKDNWAAFLGPGLRTLLARRFRDAAGFTSNSVHFLSIAERWLKQRNRTVIYSGVADTFLENSYLKTTHSVFDLVLVGSIYNSKVLCHFLTIIQSWLKSLSLQDRNTIRFVYAGASVQCINTALNVVKLSCDTEITGYLSLPELATRCRRAFANCYVWLSFHHKLLELLSCGRPVISFPGESPESFVLAEKVSTPFRVCHDRESLYKALTYAWDQRYLEANNEGADQWRWSSMAQQLEDYFDEIIELKS